MDSLYPAFVSITLMFACTILPGAYDTMQSMGLHRSAFTSVLTINVILLFIYFTHPQFEFYIGFNLAVSAVHVLKTTWSHQQELMRVAFTGLATSLFMTRVMEWVRFLSWDPYSYVAVTTIGWVLVVYLFSVRVRDRLSLLAAIFVWSVLLTMMAEAAPPYHIPVLLASSAQLMNCLALGVFGLMLLHASTIWLFHFRSKKDQAVI
jgi:hypothetical protein